MQATTYRRLTAIGFGALLVGIGLGRLTYASLTPLMIADGWLSKAAANYAGAANFAGYGLGALMAQRIAQAIGAKRAVLLGLALTTLGLAGMALPAGLAWALGARALAGVGGALLMVIAPAMVLRYTPFAQRLRVNSLVFTGMGVGLAFAALVLPEAHHHGPAWSWLLLAGLAGAITLGSWAAFPRMELDAPPPPQAPTQGWNRSLTLVLLAYALDPIGFAPFMLFWGDYLEADLQLPPLVVSEYMGLFGVAAALGPLLMGALARRFSPRWVLFGGYVVKGGVLLATWASAHPVVLVAVTAVIGAMIPANIALTSARTAVLAGPIHHPTAWRRMVLAIAIGQTLATYGLSVLYDLVYQDYVPLFAWGAGAMVLCALLTSPSWAVNRRATPPQQPDAATPNLPTNLSRP